MRIFPHLFAIIAMSLGGACQAWAQPDAQTQLQAFMQFPLHQTLLARALASYSPTVFKRCPSLKSSSSRVTVLATAAFDAKGVPNKGFWKEAFPVSGCGNDTTLNIYFIIGKDGQIHGLAGVPGQTLADVVLQRDALTYVRLGVASRAASCDDLQVKTTKVVAPPEAPHGPWSETWTAVACGNTYDVPVSFVPDAGGTTVSVSTNGIAKH